MKVYMVHQQVVVAMPEVEERPFLLVHQVAQGLEH